MEENGKTKHFKATKMEFNPSKPKRIFLELSPKLSACYTILIPFVGSVEALTTSLLYEKYISTLC